jgi:OFA family oxalate/formate antiporter-like MFS transporter
MVGIASLGNAVGRGLGVAVRSRHAARDLRRYVCRPDLLFWFLPKVALPALMTTVTFVILMCYEGGFGTMPAFTADYFGPKNVGPIYGLMLTAWSFASVVGPLYIARMRETAGNYAGALHGIAGMLAISILLPIFVRRPSRERSA